MSLTKEITISLCMIVKNEEDTIDRCLESVKGIADEIVIIDTGSNDKTKAVVKKYTEFIYDFTWIDDFAAARNFAFSKATKEYILWLDADDVILPEDKQKFLYLKASFDRTVDSVNMHYHLALDQNGNPTSSLKRNRLVKASNNFRWVGAVHEYLAVSGKIINSDIAITHKSIHHDSDRNLRIYEKMLSQKRDFTPRDLFYFANELLDHQQHERAIYFYQKFLATKLGWVEDNLAACGKLADCYNHLNDKEQELKFILKSFEYESPRAEFCCRLGYYFLQNNSIKEATFWYKLATQLEKPDTLGLLNHACWTWLPHLQLCVCYDRLGKHKQAYRHNEIARSFMPNDPSVLHNKKYLEGILYKKS